MQEPGRRPFAGVDLRRPKGYPAPPSTATPTPSPVEEAGAGDPCPRCESRDTKFCYYNNYNTSQPRHYCRSCRRYWTKGGSLRNVPVGGGSRKSASSSSASSSSSSASSSASPKRAAKNSKRQRVAPPEPEPGSTDDVAAGAAEKETTISGTIGRPTTDVDAARDTASGTVGYPGTAVDAARATPNGTVCDPATAEERAGTEGTANGTVDDPATALDAVPTEATADGATDDASAPPAVDRDVGLADPSVALGLGVSEEPFEWPSGCDLGSYWVPGVFADTDPVLFLNLP